MRLFLPFGGNTEDITWTQNGTSNTYDLEYSTNAGVSWIRIVTNYSTTGGSYDWTVPNTPTANALVRVIDHDNNTILDTSNAVFTIGPAQPFIILNTPDGGENVFADATFTIQWISAFLSNPNVLIEYSGRQWNELEYDYCFHPE